MRNNLHDNEMIYSAKGIVVHGRGKGKFVGMPTANLKVDDEKSLPDTGVYVAKILIDDRIFYGITHIGTRPTVDNDTDISIETHIMNFNENIYDKVIEIKLYKKLRDFTKFNSVDELLEQIRKDCISTNKYWNIDRNDNIKIELENRKIYMGNELIQLSDKEFDIFYLLYSNPDIVFSKKQIYEATWHEKNENANTIVDELIDKILKKFKSAENAWKPIIEISSKGYKYNN